MAEISKWGKTNIKRIRIHWFTKMSDQNNFLFSSGNSKNVNILQVLVDTHIDWSQTISLKLSAQVSQNSENSIFFKFNLFAYQPTHIFKWTAAIKNFLFHGHFFLISLSLSTFFQITLIHKTLRRISLKYLNSEKKQPRIEINYWTLLRYLCWLSIVIHRNIFELIIKVENLCEIDKVYLCNLMDSLAMICFWPFVDFSSLSLISPISVQC